RDRCAHPSQPAGRVHVHRADAERRQRRAGGLWPLPEQPGGPGLRIHGDRGGCGRGGRRPCHHDNDLPPRPQARRRRPQREEAVTADTVGLLVALVLLFPLGGAAACGLLGPRLGRRFVNIAGTVSILASFVVAVVVLANVVGAPAGQQSTTVRLWQW